MSKIIILAALLGALSFTTGAIAAEGEALPKRKPGAWEIITVAPVSGMTKSTICVGEDDDLITPSEGDCTKPRGDPSLNEGLTLDLTCTDAQGNKQSISASFTGNFDERYRATLKTNFDPPIGGPHMGVNIDGRFLGPDCPYAG